MNALVRLVRAAPLVIFLAVVAVLVYALVSWARSPRRAKEVLVRLFLVLTAPLTMLFCLASAYAVLEGNQPVLDMFSAFAAVSALALGVTCVCWWRLRR